MISISKKELAFLLIAVSIPLCVQFARIERPFVGHYASYQGAVMASIARNMVREDFKEIFLPKTNLLIIAPEKSLHLNQYPFPSLFVAFCVKFAGGSFEFWGRFQAILFNFFSACLLLLVGARLFDRNTGLVAFILFLLLPFSVIYGQMFICESMAVFFLLASILLLVKKNTLSLWRNVAAALLFSVAIANRAHFIFFFPLFFSLLWRYPNRFFSLISFSFFALFLPASWYLWTYYVGQFYALTTHTSLFFQASTPTIFGINLLWSTDYWRRVFDIFSGAMLTPLIFPIVPLGLVLLWNGNKKAFIFSFIGIGGGLLTLFLIPKKVIDQDFYLYGLFPFLLLVAAYALARLSEAFPLLKKFPLLLVGASLLAGVSARYFVHPIFKYPVEEKNIPAIGEWVQGETKPNDIVVLTGSSTALLNYYINRPVYGFSLEKDKVFSPYFVRRKFNRSERLAIEEMQNAMSDEVSLLEYFKKQGASYILILDEGKENFSALLKYLKANDSQVPSKFSNLYLFRFRKQSPGLQQPA